MSKHSLRDESSSCTAHKRHATAPQDGGPIPSASTSSSSSLTQASSSSTPKIPLYLIADLILPFVADRTTWNSVYCASKELCVAGKKMTPPWPNMTRNFGHHSGVSEVTFSPTGTQMAFEVSTDQNVIHVWDRWGIETLLAGHFCCILCLEYSSDGEHLASGSNNGSIRLWHTESFRTTSSRSSRERLTETPGQADTILSGGRKFVTALSFSRTDSNILASGGSAGNIKVWNVKEQACIHSFDAGRGYIHSLFFAGGADGTCIAVANSGSIIRLWTRVEGSSDFASETIGDIGQVGETVAVISPSGDFLATNKYSCIESYKLETMTKTQSLVMPDFNVYPATCFAVSPDSKQLVIGGLRGEIRLVQADDFSIRRDLDTRGEPVQSIAFDPTCRVLAFTSAGTRRRKLKVRTL